METYEEQYDRLVSEGVDPKLADMLAARKPPGCQTDDTYMAGYKNDEYWRDNPELAKELKRRGVNISGKRYVGQLVRPGMVVDPEAVVSGRGDIAAVCKKRGWNCEGAVSVKANRDCDEPKPGPKIDPSIVEEHVKAELIENPDLPQNKKTVTELREKHTERLSGG